MIVAIFLLRAYQECSNLGFNTKKEGSSICAVIFLELESHRDQNSSRVLQLQRPLMAKVYGKEPMFLLPPKMLVAPDETESKSVDSAMVFF